MASNARAAFDEPGTSRQIDVPPPPPPPLHHRQQQLPQPLQWHPQHFGRPDRPACPSSSTPTTIRPGGACAGGSNNSYWPYVESSTTTSGSTCNVFPTAWYYTLRPRLTESRSDGSTLFSIHKYPDEVLTSMNNMRLEDSLCDVTLKVQGDSVRAHKVVLAAASSYFQAMFIRWRERSCSEVELHEPELTPQTVRTLVEFAYTKEVRVTQANVQALLVSAMFLEIRHVVEACTLFMEQQLDASNCIGFAHFAAIRGCLELEAKAKKFIFDNFCEVIKHDEFLTLGSEDMLEILQQEELNVKCESQVFQAVVRWVEHDSANRMGQLEELLDKVRLSSLAPCFLEDQLEKCHIIQQLPRCVQLLVDKLKRLYQHNCTCITDVPRRPCRPQVIYSVGGFYRKIMESLNNFECYNPRTKVWTRLPDLPSPRCGSGVTSYFGKIYVVGGRTMRCRQHVDLCSLDVFDPSNNMWTTLNPMGVPRNRVGVGVLDGKIYAVGGCSGGEQHKSAERYDPQTDEWERLAPMSSVRMSAGVAVVNRLLYVIGGFDGRRRLSSVECFHPERNEWRLVEPMNRARSGAGVAVLDGHIYAVGGFDDANNQLNSVERYNPCQQIWEEVAPLGKARSGVGVAVLDGKLYALGGFDGSDFLPCVESYDPQTNSWQTEVMMMCARSGHGVTVETEPMVS